jgi:hypothetical protein
MAGSFPMIDDFAKEYLHSDLREVRETMLWKPEGLAEYDARRPLTATGTNLLGLIKHLSNTEARYFGDVFGRPFDYPHRPLTQLQRVLLRPTCHDSISCRPWVTRWIRSSWPSNCLLTRRRRAADTCPRCPVGDLR